MSIQSEINRIGTAISDHERLIGEVVTALAERCVVTEPILQARTVTPTEEVQVVTPDAGYDGLSSVTVEAAQGGEGTYGWKKCVSSLPSGYTEVEYIQSSGTEYIDTGVLLSAANIQGLRVVADIELVRTSGAWCVTGSGGAYPVIHFGVNNSGYFAYGSGATDIATTTAYTQGRNLWDYDLANRKFTVGSSVSVTGISLNTSGSGSRNFYISAYASPNGAVCHKQIIYSYKFYMNGDLIRDLIPCKSANGQIGVYDFVDGVFYGNAGSGAFVAGAESEGAATTVVGYAVSDDANAYPDGDFLDGYYYEKL